jgi:hypothetical protein
MPGLAAPQEEARPLPDDDGAHARGVSDSGLLYDNPWASPKLQPSTTTSSDRAEERGSPKRPRSPPEHTVEDENEDDEDEYDVIEQEDIEGSIPQADGPASLSRTLLVHRTRAFKRIKTGEDNMDPGSYEHDQDWQQAGSNADAIDLAGPGPNGILECVVTRPQKEGEGTPNQWVSYLVITNTDFKSFQSPHSEVRRRFTDFVYLHQSLSKEYPQCAVPPLPDKRNMSYVRGDRFSPDFTSRRAHSLQRFLKRITLHPVLRRATVLALFLESSDWNAVKQSRAKRGMSGSEAPSSMMESLTDGFLNAFSKPHKLDKRFQDVNDRAKKLDEDLKTVSKTVARVNLTATGHF